MQPENIRPPPQPSSVNAPMPLHRFDGVQVPQQYVLSESTQKVQTMPDNYGVQHTLVHDDDSLALGRTQIYSAVSGTAGESNTVNLQSFTATYGLPGSTLDPSPISNFSDRNGVPGPCGQPLGPPLPFYPAVTCEYRTMPYSSTQNEFIQHLNVQNAMQNSNTRNSCDLNLFSENNFHSQSTTENNNFVLPVSLSYQPIYSTANMTELGLLPSHTGLCGLPFPVPVGPGPAVTWTTTTTHPVHRESTSSCLNGQGQPHSVDPSTDFDVRCGLPPSVYNFYGQPSTTPAGLPLPASTYSTSGSAATVPHLPATSNCMYNRDVYGYLPSMFMDTAVTVPPSSMTFTTSGMTSYPSGSYAVGAPVFEIRPTSSVSAATVPMPSCATVTPGPPTQNFDASGADAVRGSTFPVPVAVAGTSSTTVAACGSTSTNVKSTVDGAAPPTSTAGVAGQSSTTSTSSGSGSGSPSGTSPPPPPPVSNGSSTSPASSSTAVPPPSTTSTPSTSPPVVVVRQFQTVRPYSG